MLQACEALAEAHAAGIVHRDLKPANLFLARYPDGTPCVKVLDFGISKLSGGEAGRDFDLTRTTAIMGSPYYMSPEQMRSTRSVDARADIWALGVILYELVAGRVPFRADTMPQLCAMVLQDAPAPLGSLAQTSSVSFEAVLLRCLEKDPAQRFQSIAELANALAPFAPVDAQRSLDLVARLSGAPSAPRSGGSHVAGPLVAAASSAESLTGTDFGHTARDQRRSRSLLLGVAILAICALAAAAWLLLRPTAPTAASAAAPSAHAADGVAESQIASASPPQMPASSAPSSAAPSAPAAVPSPATGATPKPAPQRGFGSRQKTPHTAEAPAPAPAPAPAAPAHSPGALDGRL